MLIEIIVGLIVVGLIGAVAFTISHKRKLAGLRKLFDQQLQAANQANKASIEAERLAMQKWRQQEEAGMDDRAGKLAEHQARVHLQQWKMDEEVKIRADAITRSAAITRGKVLEHFVGFMSNFKYHASDARFVGSPVDLIVFDGLADGKLEAVRFIEVKSGKSRLTEREDQIRQAIEEKRVSWEQIQFE